MHEQRRICAKQIPQMSGKGRREQKPEFALFIDLLEDVQFNFNHNARTIFVKLPVQTKFTFLIPNQSLHELMKFSTTKKFLLIYFFEI